jgi:hypothetical protein
VIKNISTKTNVMTFRLTLIFVFVSFLTENILSQSGNGNHLVLSYRYGGFREVLAEPLIHKERNHLLDLAYWINNEYAMVVSTNLIRSNFDPLVDERGSAEVYSLSIRRNFLQKTRHQAYLELGGGLGDYCTCGEGLPRRQDDLRYLKYALGFDLNIYRSISLGVHFQSNNIIDKIVDKYAYNVLTLSSSISF